MIHVDVKRRPLHAGDDRYGFLIQTSVDGGGWKTQYIRDLRDGETIHDAQADAENIAKIFLNGCRFAGAEVRATFCGYTVSW